MRIGRKSIDFNMDTGAVLTEKEYQISNSSLILNTGKKRFLKKMYRQNPEFTKASYLGYWYLLLDFLEMNTNRLVVRKKLLGKWLESQPITNEFIYGYLKISKASYYRFIKECMDKGYIRKSSIRGGGASYYMNPVYALNGEGVSVELYLIFEGVKSFESKLSKKDKELINHYLGIQVEDQNNGHERQGFEGDI